MRTFLKTFAFLLALSMLLSMAACGGGGETTEATKEAAQTTEGKTTTAATEPKQEADPSLTVHENTFFTVGYSEEEGWVMTEEDYYIYDEGGNADVMILDADGYAELCISIEADIEDASDFRSTMHHHEFDMKAYAAGELETVDVGGQSMLYVDQGSTRYFFGRNAQAGVNFTVEAFDWEDPRVQAVVENITFTASGTDNIDPPWPWEGEPFSSDTLSQTVGTYTVTAEFLGLSEPLTTFETFNHDVAALGDKVYLLSAYELREYILADGGLTFSKEIPLDAEYETIESGGGQLILSNFMEPTIGCDGSAITFSYEGPDRLAMEPDGTWGISWFYSGEDCQKFTFSGDALSGEAFPFNEVDTIRHLNVDDSYIYVCGAGVDSDDHEIFVYDHSGQLQMRLGGEPDGFGLGSITYVARTANGFLAMDGNMREVVLWSEDGTWLGAVEDSDLFGTYYPWFAAGEMLPDGSILVVMSEERADESAKEAIVFRITVS